MAERLVVDQQMCDQVRYMLAGGAPVMKVQALASWQVDVMEHGPSALQVEEEPVRCPYFKEMFRTCDFDNTFVCAFSAEYKNCSWYRMKMTGRPVFYEGRHQKKDVPDHPEG